MKTVLLDLSGSISRFRPAKMFYYPFLQNGQLFFFGPMLSESGHPRLGEQAGRVLSILKREGISSGEWQAIIVIDDEGAGQELNPFWGSMNDKIDQLNKKLFVPLRQENRAPAKTYLVNIEKRVSSDLARVKKLDLDGFLSEKTWEGDGAVFSEDDFDRINKSWNINVDLTGWVEGEALPPELKETLEVGCHQLLSEMTAIVGRKRQGIQLNTPGNSRFFDEELLNIVASEFTQSIEYRKANPHSFVSFNPSALLKSILGNHYSITSVNENQFCCISYQASEWVFEETSHDTKKRLGILRFTYFLLCLIEHGPELKLKSDDCWQVSQIGLDESKLQNGLLHCYHRWTAKIEELENEHDAPITTEVTLLKSLCECTVETDLKEIEAKLEEQLNTKPGIFKELHPFLEWEKRGTSFLHQYCENLEEHWRDCLDEIRMNRKKSVLHHLNAEEQLKSHKAEEVRIKKSIAGLNYSNLNVSWPVSCQGKMDKIHDLLFSFPRPIEFVLVVGATSLVFLIPYFIDVMKSAGFGGFREPVTASVISLFLGTCLLAAFAFRFYRRRTVNRLIAEGQTLMRQELAELRENVRNNQKYMSTICQLGNVVRNQEVLAKSYESGKEQKRKIKYFQGIFREHIGWLKKFITIKKGDNPALLPQISLSIDLPPELNENFCPTCGSLRTPSDVEVRLGTVVKVLKTNHCPGLREIQMNVVTSSAVLVE